MLRGSLRAAPRRERLVIQSLRGLLLCGIDRSSLECLSEQEKQRVCFTESGRSGNPGGDDSVGREEETRSPKPLTRRRDSDRPGPRPHFAVGVYLQP